MLHPSKKYDSGNILKVQFVLGFLFVFVSMWVPNVHWDASGVQITGTLDPVVRLTVKWCYSKWRTDKEILSLCLVLRCRLLGSAVLLLGVNRGLGLRPFQKSKQRSFFFLGGFVSLFQGYLCLDLAIYFESCHVQDAGKNSFISFSPKNDESDKKEDIAPFISTSFAFYLISFIFFSGITDPL